MESSAGVIDDQGSGWLEVKKKHRSSSKLSVNNSAGGSSRRNANGKSGTSHGKHVAQLPKSGGELGARVPEIAPNNSSALMCDGKDQACLDKCVVSEVNSCVDIPSLMTITVSNSDASLKDNKVNQEISTVVQKIKRVDLEDSGFVRHSASEIKFGEIGNDDLARFRKSENLSDVTSSNLSDNQSQVNQELLVVIDSVCHTEQRCSSPEINISLEENFKRVTEVSLSSKEMPACSDRVVDYCDPPDCKEPPDLGAGLIDNDLISADCPSDAGCSLQAVKVADHVSSLTSDLGDTDISIVTSRNSSTLVTSQTPETFLPDQNSPDTLQESNPTAPSEDCKAPDEKQQAPDMEKDVEDCRSSHNNNVQGQVSKAQIMNALGEREEGESKERFRERLWCYLFENLNRAVDELYLLCELECDLEQVREAILVLEEAKSDFRELNFRVEEFENTKRNVSHLVNVAPVTVKSDRRRPHSLSWEVRRMTTSPHRAEILSSSLEAFKKFQEEREKIRVPNDLNSKEGQSSDQQFMTIDVLSKSSTVDADSEAKPRRHSAISDPARTNIGREKKSIESTRTSKLSSVRTNRLSSQSSPNPDVNGSKLPARGPSTGLLAGKNKREQVASVVEGEKHFTSVDLGSQNSVNDKEKEKETEKEKEKRNSVSWKSMDAWKEKRNWEEILASSCRISSRVSHSPCLSRKSAERARILHDKLMTPDKKKKTAVDLKKEAEEKHARAMRIKREFDNERVQKFQKSSEKLNRVTEWQAVRSMKLKEGMYARHQRSETRHEAYIAQVVKRAGEESVKVNEVRFITSLNDENKKFMLHQRLHGSEMRRAEKLQVLKIKQKEDMAREEAVLERRKLLEAEKLQRLAVIQRKKEEAQVRREEERKASSAAREAKTLEQLRRREERAKAQQEEAELLAQKLAERLRESEQRRKVYLEQIRERASMDFRDHSSPLTRRPLSKDGQGRLAVACSVEDNQLNNILGTGDSNPAAGNANPQHLLKRRIKKIRQRLMSLKHDYPELSVPENSGLGYRTAMTTARARIGRWLQDLQRCRQARKEGASSIGLITAEMIKFLEGKELELHASRQAGLLDFISSALPASHTSKPEACQVTNYLLRLLKVILSLPTNRSYFLAQNLLPPTIPMLTAALENYIKIAASINSPGSSILPTNKTSEIFDSISEVLDGFLWTVTMIIGHESSDERHLQMQDGLLELVVFYQIIHRLRDLFALHDRPQVEGSPFPSSILLSINLLVALTTRSRTVSSIDWESFSNGNPGSENFIPHDADTANIVGSVVNSFIKEPKGPSAADLHNESQGEQFGECTAKGSHDSVSSEVECSKEQQKNNQTVLIYVDLGTTSALDESKRNCSAVTSKSSSPQKDDNTMEVGVGAKDEASMCLKAPQGFLLSAISETGLVSLLSLLTAVLLQANNRTSEQPAYVLPSNFEEVAIGVLKVLNNLALMDLTFLQEMLARPDLKMEFFHIMSFLLTHCTGKWKASSDQVGLLLLESLLLLSYFSLFHPGNQAVLRWGKGTTILHKLCDLPFTFFSDPELMPVLAGTLMAACYRCEQNRGVVLQELSTEMLLTLVKSCRNSSHAIQSPSAEDSSESNQITVEPSRKLQSDNNQAQKFGRFSSRTTSRSSLARSSVQGGSIRGGRLRNNKESRIGNRVNDEVSLKDRMLAPALMLHSRFPLSFIDRVEHFFSAEISCMDEECV